MCAGALMLARRAERVVFGAWDPKVGACGSVWDIPRDRRNDSTARRWWAAYGKRSVRASGGFLRRATGLVPCFAVALSERPKERASEKRVWGDSPRVPESYATAPDARRIRRAFLVVERRLPAARDASYRLVKWGDHPLYQAVLSGMRPRHTHRPRQLQRQTGAGGSFSRARISGHRGEEAGGGRCTAYRPASGSHCRRQRAATARASDPERVPPGRPRLRPPAPRSGRLRRGRRKSDTRVARDDPVGRLWVRAHGGPHGLVPGQPDGADDRLAYNPLLWYAECSSPQPPSPPYARVRACRRRRPLSSASTARRWSASPTGSRARCTCSTRCHRGAPQLLSSSPGRARYLHTSLVRRRDRSRPADAAVPPAGSDHASAGRLERCPACRGRRAPRRERPRRGNSTSGTPTSGAPHVRRPLPSFHVGEPPPPERAARRSPWSRAIPCPHRDGTRPAVTGHPADRAPVAPPPRRSPRGAQPPPADRSLLLPEPVARLRTRSSTRTSTDTCRPRSRRRPHPIAQDVLEDGGTLNHLAQPDSPAGRVDRCSSRTAGSAGAGRRTGRRPTPPIRPLVANVTTAPGVANSPA